jgi:hypothetical protein
MNKSYIVFLRGLRLACDNYKRKYVEPGIKTVGTPPHTARY